MANVSWAALLQLQVTALFGLLSKHQQEDRQEGRQRGEELTDDEACDPFQTTTSESTRCSHKLYSNSEASATISSSLVSQPSAPNQLQEMTMMTSVVEFLCNHCQYTTYNLFIFISLHSCNYLLKYFIRLY
ncbi:hypothetical protein OSTOST_17966 [Ostertagia ostertagi]